MNELISPLCPFCSEPPVFMLAGGAQMFCGSYDCKALTWNGTLSVDENLENISFVDLSSLSPSPGEGPGTSEGLCEAGYPRPGGWLVCRRPAASEWRYTCEHGHVADRRTCSEHAPEPGMVGCKWCFEDGHECPMTFTRTGGPR